MDTPYVAIILVIFLVFAGLVIDVGYLYVDREELRNAAEAGALAGVRSFHDRFVSQLRQHPEEITAVTDDTTQTTLRRAVRSAVMGGHESAAVIGVGTGRPEESEGDDDIRVGRWDGHTGRFLPGETPVNAVQVTTHRTAEHSLVGIGNLGNIFSRLVGVDETGATATAVATLKPYFRPGAVLKDENPSPSCRFPAICAIPERTITLSGDGGYASPLTVDTRSPDTLSQFVCLREPRQEVCGKSVTLLEDRSNRTLADLATLMEDPTVDPSHKDIDPSVDRVSGWWVILPVVAGGGEDRPVVNRYALIRISRICAGGATGCGGRAPSSPSCDRRPPGITFDRLSWIDCDSPGGVDFPGFDPVLVR